MRKNRVIEQNRCYHLVGRLAYRAFFLDDEEKDRAVALVRRPNEPAVLNNLAIIYCRMKKFDFALEYARKAVKLVPGNREVQKTLVDIEELFLKENNR